MRRIAEIRKDIASKIEAIRSLDPKNSEAVDKALEELHALEKELEKAESVEAAQQKLAEQRIDRAERIAGRKFSFVKFVREIAEGKGLTGLEAEVAEEGAQEYRRMGLSRQGQVIPASVLSRAATGQNVAGGTATEGANLKEGMPATYVQELKEKLIIAQLGATVLTDLVGELPVITSQQISASWLAEAAAGSATKASYAKAVMSPKRNFVQTAVTLDLLRQTSYDVEADLMNKMAEAHANLIEAAAINGSGSNNQPTGILNTSGIGSVAMGTNGGALTWAKVVALESQINANNANRGRIAYLTNAKVIGAMKTTEKAQGTARFIMDDNNAGRVNGYTCEWTNLVPSNLTKGTSSGTCSALIMGNFQDLYVGSWGGLDLVVDPYTKAANGEVVLTINAYNDVLVAEPKSFAAIKDITTA